MQTITTIDIVAICFFIMGFLLGKYKKKQTKTTCSFVDRPIIPGDRKDGPNEPPTSPKPQEYRPIIEGDRKDYNPPPTAPKPKEYRGRTGGDRKDYNSPPTSPKPDFLKPHLPLSSGLWGRKDRKDEPFGPKPTTRPWAQ